MKSLVIFYINIMLYMKLVFKLLQFNQQLNLFYLNIIKMCNNIINH